MQAHARQALLVTFGAATAVACSLAYRLLAPRLSTDWPSWVPVVVTALSGALVAFLTAAFVRHRYRRLLGRVGDLAQTLRATPSSGLMTQAQSEQAGRELAPLWPHLEAI